MKYLELSNQGSIQLMCIYHLQADNLESLIRIADERMYEQKKIKKKNR